MLTGIKWHKGCDYSRVHWIYHQECHCDLYEDSSRSENHRLGYASGIKEDLDDYLLLLEVTKLKKKKSLDHQFNTSFVFCLS